MAAHAASLWELQMQSPAGIVGTFTQNRRGKGNFGVAEHFIGGVREIPGGV
jgi:hypothetical protein